MVTKKSLLEFLVQNTNGEIYDISQLITSVPFTDNINKSGIVNFSMLEDKNVNIDEGSIVRLSYQDEVYFLGYVFKIEYTKSKEIKLTAYDQMRYLKANETYVFNNITASQGFRQICNDFNLKVGEIQDTKYKLTDMIFDDKGLLDIIADCLKITLRNTNQMYFVKDIVGELVLKNINTTIVDFVVDPESSLLDYNYSRSIDDDTYNQIKLVRDNKETGKRDAYISKDSSTIKKWGLLQYYEKADDNFNEAQIKSKADSLLSLKNRVLKTLTNVNILGDKSIRAGNVIFVNIPERNIQGFLLCTTATHTFTNASHTVKADFKMV